MVFGSNPSGVLRRADGKKGNISSPIWMKAVGYEKVSRDVQDSSPSSAGRLRLSRNQDVYLTEGLGAIFNTK
jgi:hypothetical protein